MLSPEYFCMLSARQYIYIVYLGRIRCILYKDIYFFGLRMYKDMFLTGLSVRILHYKCDDSNLPFAKKRKGSSLPYRFKIKSFF